MKTTNRRNLFILAFSLLVVMRSFGMVIPVFPFLIDELGASGSALGLLVATAVIGRGLLTGFVTDAGVSQPSSKHHSA